MGGTHEVAFGNHWRHRPKYLEKKYVAPTISLSIDQIMEKRNCSIMMINIASTLNYVEFDEVKDCPTTHEMWNN